VINSARDTTRGDKSNRQGDDYTHWSAHSSNLPRTRAGWWRRVREL